MSPLGVKYFNQNPKECLPVPCIRALVTTKERSNCPSRGSHFHVTGTMEGPEGVWLLLHTRTFLSGIDLSVPRILHFTTLCQSTFISQTKKTLRQTYEGLDFANFRTHRNKINEYFPRGVASSNSSFSSDLQCTHNPTPSYWNCDRRSGISKTALSVNEIKVIIYAYSYGTDKHIHFHFSLSLLCFLVLDMSTPFASSSIF